MTSNEGGQDAAPHDLSTFVGRLRHFYVATNPLKLFYTASDIKAAQSLIESHTKDSSDNACHDSEQVLRAQRIVDSAVHPDTGEIIPLPLRFSAFVPTNLIVVAGMLRSNPSTLSIIGWQWANQSLNTAVNYANANKSSPLTNQDLIKAYLSATTAAVTLAVGLNRLVPRLQIGGPRTKAILAKMIPFVAVATAGTVNVFLIRGKELRTGIAVFRPSTEGEESVEIGKSRVAARKAITEVAFSRVLTNAPTLVLPPLLFGWLSSKFPAVRRSQRLGGAVNLGLIGTALMVFLPPALATFPQRAQIDPLRLESEFHHFAGNVRGQPLLLEYNKGL